MPARLKTSCDVIVSTEDRRLRRKLRGSSLSSAKKLFPTFFTCVDTGDTILWFPPAREKIMQGGKTCFSFRSNNKNRSLFRSHTVFHLREGKKRAMRENAFSLLSIATSIKLEIAVSIFKQIPFFHTCRHRRFYSRIVLISPIAREKGTQNANEMALITDLASNKISVITILIFEQISHYYYVC